MARLLILIIAMCTTAVVFPFSASVRSLKGVPLLFVNQIPYSPLIYNACGNSEATFHTIELAKKQG
ncbi:MAG: hypothetical protein ACPLSK_02635, partial [bacterium]